MIIQDDRTEHQKETHIWAIVATDKFMSYWGACPGKSVAIWAFQSHEEAVKFSEYIQRRRRCMKYVRVVNFKTYRIRQCYHCHIYPIDYPKLED